MMLWLGCLLSVIGFAAGSVGHGYQVVSAEAFTNGLVVLLELKQKTSFNGPDAENLQVTVSYESSGRLHVHITTSNATSNARWEIPQSLIPRETPASHNNQAEQYNALSFQYTQDPFTFMVARSSTGEVLFDSSSSNLTFKDQYLEISTLLLESAALYGLGESTRPKGFRLRPGQSYTLWASDINASTVNVDLYGAHPFYMDVRDAGSSHGVLLLNSNGMDIAYTDNSLVYKVIGGVLDFYFFPGPEPLAVMRQYTELVGRPAPMPFWSFGFHQCRYGYKSVEDLEFVVSNYRAAGIPLEVMWNDIDYMDLYKDFTFDPINYPVDKMRKFVDDLHQHGQKYVLILDPGISTADNYSTFQHGMEKDIFIKHKGVPYLAQVWPGPVYFTDFLHPDIDSFWGAEIENFHALVPFDGLWIDMNEASNFCSGTLCKYPTNSTCKASLNQAYCCLICSDEEATIWDNPPYAINAGGIHRGLGMKTIATSAYHDKGYLSYDTHNLYGFSEAVATNRALKGITGKRPFILSRSTFPGTGAYAAHWTGDNSATWEDLRYSIAGILNSGLFGVPMVGADICGFLGDTTEELCARWIQLGAFYPFSRNHADIGSRRQELYLWDSVAHTARKALSLRYRLLPYLYTLMQEAHECGAPVARPLFFTFTEDRATLDVSSQFLLGRGVLVSPVLEAGAESVAAYFPKGTWYSLSDGGQEVVESQGSLVTLPSPLDTINVHVYEGTIIPMQEAAMTTGEVRQSPFTLLIAFKYIEEASSMEQEGQTAIGEIYIDEGEDMEMALKEGKSTRIKLVAELKMGQMKVASYVECAEYAFRQGFIIDKIVVLGLRAASQPLVRIDGAKSLPEVGIDRHVIALSRLNLPLASAFTLTLDLLPWQLA
ncbi:hypothetical protein GOP47_0012575 [Adiantum capillus-veneris]|uniref:alpha-glucosidase n=1 Tax=Adiantum capillus-veneris TaxID=13818 RepID=A0A9D4UQY0_ADICA|nr:hypothetical protein GOP47_0012575 [Adiantum capillus-veneris]